MTCADRARQAQKTVYIFQMKTRAVVHTKVFADVESLRQQCLFTVKRLRTVNGDVRNLRRLLEVTDFGSSVEFEGDIVPIRFMASAAPLCQQFPNSETVKFRIEGTR